MALPRNRTAGSGEWLRKRVDKLLDCPEFLAKLKEVTAFQDERRYSFDCSRELATFACMAISPHQGRPEFLNHCWARGMGKTWKALQDFPNRLEKIADDVERINNADRLFYARRRGKDLSRFELLRLREQCMQLPVVMRIYADALRERNAAVSAATPRSGRSIGLFELNELVKFITGQWHDAKTADLLNAAAEALNETSEFDALTIAQARSRRRKKTT